MPDCDACGGCSSCGGCGGCGKSLSLSQPEVDMLQMLGQIPFLPVARKTDDMTPVYLEQTDRPQAEYSLVLQHLEAKGLISIDYDFPLSGFDMSPYAGYPVHGSFALTARGQQVLDLLDMQGIE